MQIDPKSPIGVFDSGVGGLTVVRALMERLPFENIVYFGDTARVPYGVKSVETIGHYTTQIAEFLLEKQVKLLIIACNTMAAVAAQTSPSAIPGAGAGCDRRRCDWRAGRDPQPANRRDRHAHHHQQRCLCPSHSSQRSECTGVFSSLRAVRALVEEGWLDHPVTRLTAQDYLKTVLAQEVDTLVLGCTHYPLLKPLLQDVVGPSVRLIDSAQAMAQRTAALLKEQQIGNPNQSKPRYDFYVTDVPLRFQTIGERFLGRALPNVHLVKW